MVKSARQQAFDILLRVERNGAYSNLALDKALSNSGADTDASFLTALVYGTLERLLTIDYNLSLYLRQPLKKLRPQVLTALRLGTYQLLFMDKVPESAAVNESVKLVKNNNASYSSGLVNAVLRNVAKNGLKYPDTDDEISDWSVRFSVADWIVKLWVDSYGRDTALGMLEAMTMPAPIYIRVNSQKCTAAELSDILDVDGVQSRAVPDEPFALELINAGSIERLDAYKNGLFHVQDLSSQLCCKALDPQPGERIFDMCAAPGGKSFTLAQMMSCKGELLSFDIYASRLKLIADGAERLGLHNIAVGENDSAKYNPLIGTADRVLCDVPCSGLGILRRKPEIRYKTLEDIDKLPSLQYDILYCCSKYVKVGGRLVYSTCALNPAENSFVCGKFLQSNPDFKLLPTLPEIKRGDGETDFLTVMPHIHSADGFFIASFIRTE